LSIIAGEGTVSQQGAGELIIVIMFDELIEFKERDATEVPKHRQQSFK
jgi:hypothetical protein